MFKEERNELTFCWGDLGDIQREFDEFIFIISIYYLK